MKGILDLLETEDTRRILLMTYISPKAAIEISSKLGIPISRCYSILKELEFHGLMVSWKAERWHGRTVKVFHAKLRNARLIMNNDSMMIQFELPHDSVRPTKAIEILT
jgi:predicted transcriptional regulator